MIYPNTHVTTCSFPWPPAAAASLGHQQLQLPLATSKLQSSLGHQQTAASLGLGHQLLQLPLATSKLQLPLATTAASLGHQLLQLPLATSKLQLPLATGSCSFPWPPAAAASLGNQQAAASLGHQQAAASLGHQQAAASLGHRQLQLPMATAAAASLGHQQAAASLGHQQAAASLGHQLLQLPLAAAGKAPETSNTAKQGELTDAGKRERMWEKGFGEMRRKGTKEAESGRRGKRIGCACVRCS
jgi:hypothetical protein